MNPLLPTSVEIVFAFIAFGIFALALAALFSIARSAHELPTKIVWALFVILAPALGAAVWFISNTKETRAPHAT